MKLGELLVSILVFIFSIFLFSPLNDAIASMTYEGALKPVLQAFPLMFIMVSAVFPILLLWRGKNDR